jgi:hypothetical protein
MKPAMSPEHHGIMCGLIDGLLGPDLRILEYGCGLSTIAYARRLFKRNQSFLWACVETDPEWLLNVSLQTQDLPVVLKMLPVRGDQDAVKRMPMDEYVEAPALFRCKWDLVLVDGRKRARCIEHVKDQMQITGKIVLHDAQRIYYHAACEGLEIVKHVDDEGDELWVMT